MNVSQIIADKRDGKTLEDAQLEFLISGFANEVVPDYQMAAFAMAVYFQGMSPEETTVLTRCMIDSGERMEWPLGKPRVDKHSTGGIGDKISIPLAPLLACCGVEVPMISGRGLGATGGTLDKLESIPGYRCNLSNDEFRSIVNWNGCSIASASAKLAPADKRFYALRDVTATVPSIPLITASILSKKVAEGIDCLVLDVKCGSGAFMKNLEDARELAESLVRVGNGMGVKTSALITDMSQPLGQMIGNGVEIDESVEVLKGEGPRDVTELTYALGAKLLVESGVQPNEVAARAEMAHHIENGEALKKLAEMVKSHGGDLESNRSRAKEQIVVSIEDGFVSQINAERLGLAIIEMGGGRKQMGDELDYSVGMKFLVRLGDQIKKGEPIATLYCPEEKADYITSIIVSSIHTSPVAVDPTPLILESVS